jgi:hypothetical protein
MEEGFDFLSSMSCALSHGPGPSGTHSAQSTSTIMAAVPTGTQVPEDTHAPVLALSHNCGCTRSLALSSKPASVDAHDPVGGPTLTIIPAQVDTCGPATAHTRTSNPANLISCSDNVPTNHAQIPAQTHIINPVPSSASGNVHGPTGKHSPSAPEHPILTSATHVPVDSCRPDPTQTLSLSPNSAGTRSCAPPGILALLGSTVADTTSIASHVHSAEQHDLGVHTTTLRLQPNTQPRMNQQSSVRTGTQEGAAFNSESELSNTPLATEFNRPLESDPEAAAKTVEVESQGKSKQGGRKKVRCSWSGF